MILHSFHLTQEIFYVRTVAQLPWEKMNAKNLNCNCKICDTIVNVNAMNHALLFLAISKISIIFLLLAISKRIEQQVLDWQQMVGNKKFTEFSESH